MSTSYDPHVYDRFFSVSQGGDAEWYLARARESGGPILELGAGTGRVVVPIAEAGLAIDAMDNDERMLAALEQRVAALPPVVQERIGIVRGDMRRFALERRYKQIQIPYRAFLNNLCRKDQLSCLRCCRAHLTRTGLLVLNVFRPSLEHMSRHGRGVWRCVREIEHLNGGSLVHSVANQFDALRQRLTSYNRFEDFTSDGSLKHTFLQRLDLAYLYPGEIRGLLREAGFDDITLYGGFNDEAVDDGGQEVVVCARS